jgi:hypothetical protein
MANSVAVHNDGPVDRLIEAASSGPTPLLKFKKTKFECQEVEIPLGTKFVAYCADWRRGWVKFAGDEKVDERIGRVVDKFEPCERDELGDLDQSEWETDDITGEPTDPWCLQHYVPLENLDSGERYLFVTSSTGGRIAIESLVARWGREVKKNPALGLPVIRLATGQFGTKKFGSVARPDFPIVGWEDGEPIGVRPIRDVTPPKPAAKEEAADVPWWNDDDPNF